MRRRAVRHFFCFLPSVYIALVLLWIGAAGAQETVSVDLSSGWIHRDWDRCGTAARWTAQEDTATVETKSPGAVLFWQVPTLYNHPLAIDTSPSWISHCERPPLDFWKKMRKREESERFSLSVEQYSHLSWKWQLHPGARPAGQEQKAILELGIAILKKDSDDLRELVYNWHRRAPEDSAWTVEETIIPGIWKLKKAHVVAERGWRNEATWMLETRDIYADYKRAFPREEPGRIARIYVKVPDDAKRSDLKVSLSHIYFYSDLADAPVVGAEEMAR